MLIRPGFYNDHEERGLPSSVIYAEREGGFLVDTDDPAFAELLSDARRYAGGEVDQARLGLVRAAKALLRAVEEES